MCPSVILLGFSNKPFVFTVNLESGEHSQFLIMICYTNFPIIMQATPQTQFAIRGQDDKVTVPLNHCNLAIQWQICKKKIFF